MEKWFSRWLRNYLVNFICEILNILSFLVEERIFCIQRLAERNRLSDKMRIHENVGVVGGNYGST